MLYENKKIPRTEMPNFMQLPLYFFRMLALGNIKEKEEKGKRAHWFFRGKKTNRMLLILVQFFVWELVWGDFVVVFWAVVVYLFDLVWFIMSM